MVGFTEKSNNSTTFVNLIPSYVVLWMFHLKCVGMRTARLRDLQYAVFYESGSECVFGRIQVLKSSKS